MSLSLIQTCLEMMNVLKINTQVFHDVFLMVYFDIVMLLGTEYQ